MRYRISGLAPLAALLATSLIGDLSIYGDEHLVDFNRDVRPLLSDNCLKCHGPDAEARQADLRLDTRDGLFAQRDEDPLIVSGDPEASLLWRRVSSDDEFVVMPPPDSHKALSETEQQLVRRWIEQGAKWSEHWSFISPARPEPPVAGQSGWVRNEIDRFVAARLQQEGVEPSREATKRQLVRRLHLDLLGLPPTRAQVQAFLQDQEPGAYERLVDRLLASPHYGERMAVAWLDLARYADTNGYSIDGGRHMWLWRDWVIQAFNENMPFDQFTIEQLAGDLLPDAGRAQRIATGFNRNHMITHEGGTIPEENLVNYAADRVKTTAQVFLGLTMGCAQCHDHKYDPISQRDYYRFFAYFNTLGDRGLDGNGGKNADPKIRSRALLGLEQIDEIDAQIETLQKELNQPLPNQLAWEEALRLELAQRGEDLQLHPLRMIKVTSPNRADPYEFRDDGTVFNPSGGGRSPSLSMQASVDDITGLRIEFIPHESFPEGRSGLGSGERKGGFILTSFSASATSVASDQVDIHEMIPIRQATASFSHPSNPPGDALDPRDHNGWSPYPKDDQPQHVTFTFEKPIHASETPYITVMLVWGGGQFSDGSLVAGQYRVSAVTGSDDGTSVPQEIQNILEVDPAARCAQQAERIRAYRASVAPELLNTRRQLANLKSLRATLMAEHEVMVMNVADDPRQTHILNRGQYDQPGEAVTAGTPASLLPLSDDAPPNRLGLARWLVRREHPLTARVAVNRLWEMLFGTGLVATPEDFGAQGQTPSHPELLDWLAVDFIESGWDVKGAVKQMVMSATYRQDSRSSRTALQHDPTNRLLARGPRKRIPAEFVRDSALAISGLLVPRIGGPSVHPYQAPNLWREISHYGSTPATAQVFVQDHGERLYRRSLYTYWKRTAPPPTMFSFDAPNREVCTVTRASTTTPLQALVLLNDVQFVEAARAFAQRIMIEPADDDVESRIEFAYQTALARSPTAEEAAVVEQTFRRELASFRADLPSATGLVSVGESNRNRDLDVAEHAAWTTVATLMLNLSETITKE